MTTLPDEADDDLADESEAVLNGFDQHADCARDDGPEEDRADPSRRGGEGRSHCGIAPAHSFCGTSYDRSLKEDADCVAHDVQEKRGSVVSQILRLVWQTLEPEAKEHGHADNRDRDA